MSALLCLSSMMALARLQMWGRRGVLIVIEIVSEGSEELSNGGDLLE